MLPASHFVSQKFPGHGPPDGRCVPHSGVSVRTFIISSCSSHNDYTRFPQVKVVSLGYASRNSMSFVCNANSSGDRRNPDFPRQSRHGYSRNKNRHNEDRDSIDAFEDSDIFSSKNGPSLHSGSGSQKFQTTATPGPREREIVEIFRKVQAQLRERAAQKEEKKVEDSQGPNKQNETVDSLLKLLRKHSVQHKRSSNTNSRDFMLDQSEPNSSFIEDRTPKDSYNKFKHEVENNKAPSPSVGRPVSNFQRRSPVPQQKYRPFSSGEETFNPGPFTKIDGKQKETKPEPAQMEIKSEPEAESETFLSDGGVFEEVSDVETSDIEDSADEIDDSEEENEITGTDLSGMKLAELRAVAKSRGMKGFTRLKKHELLELLTSGASI